MLAPTAPDLPLEPGAQAPLRRNRPIPNAGVLVAALLGVVAGSALQMQQPSLWTATAYAACMGAALVLGIFALKLRSGHGRLPSVLVGLSAVLVFFALCGLRSLHYADTALDPALEGKDIASRVQCVCPSRSTWAGTATRATREWKLDGRQPRPRPMRASDGR